jgi:Ca-activated chloride channel family protein
MNKRQRTYDVLRVLLWIGMAELAFWLLFFLANVLIAALKNEAWQSSFLVYENPKAFWWLLLLPVLIALYLFNLHWKNSVLEKSFSIKLRGFLFRLPTPKQSFWRFLIIRTAFVFMVLAIANPQGGSRALEIDGYGGEIVVVVDISRSMLVRDMQSKRSRLDAAKNALNNMTRNIPGTSLSIYVFAGSAYTHLPMTRDLQTVSILLQ